MNELAWSLLGTVMVACVTVFTAGLVYILLMLEEYCLTKRETERIAVEHKLSPTYGLELLVINPPVT